MSREVWLGKESKFEKSVCVLTEMKTGARKNSPENDTAPFLR